MLCSGDCTDELNASSGSDHRGVVVQHELFSSDSRPGNNGIIIHTTCEYSDSTILFACSLFEHKVTSFLWKEAVTDALAVTECGHKVFDVDRSCMLYYRQVRAVNWRSHHARTNPSWAPDGRIK